MKRYILWVDGEGELRCSKDDGTSVKDAGLDEYVLGRNIRATGLAIDGLREYLEIEPVPDPASQHREVLEQAVRDDILAYWCSSYDKEGYTCWACPVRESHEALYTSPHFATEVEALAAAAAHVAKLRPVKVPEPEEMTAQACCDEMKTLGYMLQLAVPTMKYNAPFGCLDIREECDEVPSAFHRRALRAARAAAEQRAASSADALLAAELVIAELKEDCDGWKQRAAVAEAQLAELIDGSPESFMAQPSRMKIVGLNRGEWHVAGFATLSDMEQFGETVKRSVAQARNGDLQEPPYVLLLDWPARYATPELLTELVAAMKQGLREALETSAALGLAEQDATEQA